MRKDEDHSRSGAWPDSGNRENFLVEIWGIKVKVFE